MKNRLVLILLLISSIFIISCAQQEFKIEKDKDSILEADKTQEQPKSEMPGRSQVPQLGSLCTGDEECDDYCHFNSLDCEEYCIMHPENPTCQERFAFVYKEGYIPRTGPFKDYGQYSVENNGCEGKGAATFTYPPMKIEDIETIRPLGLINAKSGHITPTDHQYYYPNSWRQELRAEDLRNVYTPSDGVVTSLERMPEFFNTAKGTNIGDYRLVIHHTCTFFTIYIHLRELSLKLQEIVETRADKRSPVRVEAGELIGRATSFDFSAHNEDIILQGFVVPEHYNAEPWKIHTVDPFDYFTPDLKAELLKKNIRAAEPLGGKIDYDIDGKLIGNWFVENTYWYLGVNRPEYWKTHVAFVLDVLNPQHFIISLGDFNGEGKQFGAKGNSPNPRDVDMSSGLIKYELVDYGYFDSAGEAWNGIRYAKDLRAENSDFVQGVVLVQLIDKRKLKLEIFPGKTSAEVNAFTEKAKIYER